MLEPPEWIPGDTCLALPKVLETLWLGKKIVTYHAVVLNNSFLACLGLGLESNNACKLRKMCKRAIYHTRNKLPLGSFEKIFRL